MVHHPYLRAVHRRSSLFIVVHRCSSMFIVVRKKRPRFIVCVHRSSSWSFTGVQGSSLRSSMFIVASIQRPRFIAVFIGVHRSFNSAPKVHRCVHSCSTLRSSMFIDVHRCSSMFINVHQKRPRFIVGFSEFSHVHQQN